jgi:hypothetical protein
MKFLLRNCPAYVPARAGIVWKRYKNVSGSVADPIFAQIRIAFRAFSSQISPIALFGCELHRFFLHYPQPSNGPQHAAIDLDLGLAAYFHLLLPESVAQNAYHSMDMSQVVLFRLLRYPQVLGKRRSISKCNEYRF